jgi:hypothetical protein
MEECLEKQATRLPKSVSSFSREKQVVSNIDSNRTLLCCTWGADGAGMYEEHTGITKVPAYKQQGREVVE